MTYLLHLARLIAESLVVAMIQHAPDTDREEFLFNGWDVGAGMDEVIVVRYERHRNRPSTLEVKPAAEAVVLETV